MKELITIIVPIYNSEKYLERCLSSILNQTYSNLEIILINDGSEDSSKKICKDFANTDKRIVLINTKNNGPAKARNLGLEKATGKYISFIDADDYVEKDMIETLYKALTEKKADMVRANYDTIKDDKILSNNENVLDKLYDKNNINEFIQNVISEDVKSFIWLLLIKKECIKDNFSEEIFIYEDTNFYLTTLSNINTLYVFSKIVYHYEVNSNSVSRKAEKISQNIDNLLKSSLVFKKNLEKYKLNNSKNFRAIHTRIINSIINYYYHLYRENNNIKEIINLYNDLKKNQLFRNLLKDYDENVLSKKEKIFNSSLLNDKYLKFYLLCKCKNVLGKIRG